MDLEGEMAEKVRCDRERETPYDDVTYMQKLENKTSEQAQTEMDSQIPRTCWWLTEGRGVGA